MDIEILLRYELETKRINAQSDKLFPNYLHQ